MWIFVNRFHLILLNLTVIDWNLNWKKIILPPNTLKCQVEFFGGRCIRDDERQLDCLCQIVNVSKTLGAGFGKMSYTSNTVSFHLKRKEEEFHRLHVYKHILQWNQIFHCRSVRHHNLRMNGWLLLKRQEEDSNELLCVFFKVDF